MISVRGPARLQPQLAAKCTTGLPLLPRRRSCCRPAPSAPPPPLRLRPAAAAQPAAGSTQQHAQQHSQQPERQQAAGLPSLAARLLSPRALGCLAAAALLTAAVPGAARAAADAAASGGGGLAALAKAALSFVLHLDVHLGDIVAKYGATTYWILFAIVFAETGLVVTPFLPGDSLLFATGALAALGKLSLPLLVGCFLAAAILGDAVNYAIGNTLGSAALKSNLLKKEHIAKTEQFYAKHGAKTVVLARFVPIVRTFAPFVAGVGSMAYSTFGLYNVAGAVLWTAVCVGGGYVFGGIPAVHENFSLMVLGIVAVSLLPIAWEVYAARREAAEAAAAGGGAAAAEPPGPVPHSTPPSAAAAMDSAGMPPRMSPATMAAATEALELAKSKIADPMEDTRVDEFCRDNPSASECRVFDD